MLVLVYLSLLYVINWFSFWLPVWHLPFYTCQEKPPVTSTPSAKLIGLRQFSSEQHPMIGSLMSRWLNCSTNQMQKDITRSFQKKIISPIFMNRLIYSSLWMWTRKNIVTRICWVLPSIRKRVNFTMRRIPIIRFLWRFYCVTGLSLIWR